MGRGSLDLIERIRLEHQARNGFPSRNLECALVDVPSGRDRFATATRRQPRIQRDAVLGEQNGQANQVEATTARYMIF